MYINSPGGQVTAGLAIYDTMQARVLPLIQRARKMFSLEFEPGP
jgi:hypothetical protein